MKLSVVISTYNGASYIIELLNSILNQKRKADEVLIFDDCSTDKTVQIINDFIMRNELKNWKLIVNSKNKGWKRNFMEGIWSASGDVIFPCDQDDIWMSQKLEIMEKIMEDNPHIKILTSNYEMFYSSGKTLLGPEKNDRCLIKQPLSVKVFNTKYPGCTYCISKDIVKMSMKYWQTDFPHDALFWRIGMFTDTLYTYHDKLIRWRKHDESAYTIESIQSKTKIKKREWLDYAQRVISSLDELIKDYPTGNIEQKKRILLRTSQWIEQRKKFYDSGNVIEWMKLIKYESCYTKIRQYVGDFYLVKIKNRREGI